MSTGRVLLAAMSDDELERWLDEFRPVRYTDHTVMSRAKLREDVVAVREKGWSIVDQEYEIGFRSLSVPIRDQGDAVVAALNVCCPSPRVSLERMQEEFLPATQATAAEIQRSLPEAYRRRAEISATAGAEALSASAPPRSRPPRAAARAAARAPRRRCGARRGSRG